MFSQTAEYALRAVACLAREMRLMETDMQDMTPDEIHRFLDDARIGRLCMAGSDGRPYTIPLPFCWLDGALYVRLPLTGRKGQVLGQNDRVCFEADEFTETLDDYASVLVEGRLVEVNGVEEKRRV